MATSKKPVEHSGVLLEELPDPTDINRRLAANYSEARLLRSLIPISEKAVQWRQTMRDKARTAKQAAR